VYAIHIASASQPVAGQRLSVQLAGGQYGLRTDGRTFCRSSRSERSGPPAVCDARETHDDSDRDDGARTMSLCARWLVDWTGLDWRSAAMHSCLQRPSAASQRIVQQRLSPASRSFVVVVVVVVAASAFSAAVLSSS